MPRTLRAGTRALMAAAIVLATTAAGLVAFQPPDEFVPVSAVQQPEQLPAATLLVTAYAFVWAALLVYVWTVWRRLLRVEREIRQIASRMDESAGRR